MFPKALPVGLLFSVNSTALLGKCNQIIFHLFLEPEGNCSRIFTVLLRLEVNLLPKYQSATWKSIFVFWSWRQYICSKRFYLFLNKCVHSPWDGFNIQRISRKFLKSFFFLVWKKTNSLSNKPDGNSRTYISARNQFTEISALKSIVFY
jgi:hypothetical protein